VTSFENLLAAAYQVLRGKRDQENAGDFFFDLEGNLLRLRSELRSGSYYPGEYRTFWISDPKPRLISAAPFRDRVVHHALVNIIEPVFERRFIEHSYACRTGKGTHRALKQFIHWARSSKYVLKMDIRKFFPCIDHDIMNQRIAATLKDPFVLRLCEIIIEASNTQERVIQYFPGDDLFTPTERRIGLPIGNLTSQFFANIYLDNLDHFIKEKLKITKYLRYVDDFCCCSNDKGFLHEVRRAIVEHLADYRLKLNEGKSRVRQVKEGIEFLGFVVFPGTIRLNQRSIRRQRGRLKRLQWQYGSGEILWDDLAASLMAWNAHASHGNTWRLREDIFQNTVFRVP